ncbi:phage adaptor protein [Nitrosovibrio sp. Nv4]|uniref:phage adaptor protein n=1 Tax=Nitrosovibrio sp. Nv4 TaxID=1945880 RepID=UPI000BDD0A72|nr:hypothetical protein [Nitrosovibrio sp. Nv4]SOD41725.1 hypothetical protein SAMN06298226_2027 [Nitrosovibrio sp. Nv4]
MTIWSDFYDLVIPDLPGCTFSAADSALRQSAITFCEQSLAWQVAHPDVPVVAGIAGYAFAPPEGTVVHAVTFAALDGEEIAPYLGGAGVSAQNWRGWISAPQYIVDDAASITLVPRPGAAAILIMTVALKPSPVSTGIDDALFNEYREAIVHGALARLMLSPKKPYTNAQLAAYHQQQFSIKTAAAGLRAARSHTRAPLRTSIMSRR